jgi:RNA polymerase sigma factor (sigma-70 family)
MNRRPGFDDEMADRFDTTRWSIVLSAGEQDTVGRDALASLCKTYRPPVLAYVRGHVRDPDDAEDLTQAFFVHVLERQLAARADRERGRFRAFLLTSLKHFLASERERVGAQRRGGGTQRLPAAVIESIPAESTGPEEAFEREWARTVLREAMRRLELEAKRAGRAAMFRELRPFLAETPEAGIYDSVAKSLGMRRNTVAVAVHRLRARLQETVREVVADTAADSAEVEAELRLMRASLTQARELGM